MSFSGKDTPCLKRAKQEVDRHCRKKYKRNGKEPKRKTGAHGGGTPCTVILLSLLNVIITA